MNPFPKPIQPSHVTSMDGFMYFVCERENIRIKKKACLPTPWTNDPILAEFRFCNIRRRDDRVSRWLINNLYSITHHDLFFTAAIARLINWPPTLQHLIDNMVLPCSIDTFDRERFISAMASYKATHEKTFTGAYMIFPTNKYAPKEVGIADTLQSIVEHRELISNGVSSRLVAATCGALVQCKGLGAFMAGQVAADLTYLAGGLAQATDLYAWAPQGPGSMQGLNRMLGHSKYKGWTQQEFNEQLREVQEGWIDHYIEEPRLTLHDVQNCFCEFGKYARTALGTGRPRSKYTSHHGDF